MFKRGWLFLVLAVTAVSGQVFAADARHDVEFWRAISNAEGKPPAGQQPRDLAPELVTDLASADSELRDVLAYSILLRWIYQNTLTPDEVRPLMQTLLANLRVNAGEVGTDSVLRRSYSALILSVIAARNIDQPFLSPEEYGTLFNAALAYLVDEKDERGFDPQKGWMHSVAHTADLLKFLARDPLLTATDQARLLDTLGAKVRSATAAYTHGEDERLARVVIAVARRDAPEKSALHAWVQTVVADATYPEHLTPAALLRADNARHLLTSLWAEISIDDRPSAGLEYLRTETRDALRRVL